MSEDIKSIYAKKEDSTHYERSKNTENLDILYGGEAYAYNPRGTREKILSINQEENRTPGTRIHLSLDRYLYADKPITSAIDVVKLLAKTFGSSSREATMAILLDENYFPLAVAIDGYGSAHNVNMGYYINDVLKTVLISGAKNVILVHSHPSILDFSDRNFTPSEGDLKVFGQVNAIFNVHDINVVDSIILSERYTKNMAGLGIKQAAMYSIKEKKIYSFSDICETYIRGEGYEEKAKTDHTSDFSIDGSRVGHKNPVMTKDGLKFEDDEEKEI